MLIRNCNVRNPKSALKYSNHNEKKKFSQNKEINCMEVLNVN